MNLTPKINHQVLRPTQRAADWRDSATRFAVKNFSGFEFSCSQTESMPVHQRVTPTVGRTT